VIAARILGACLTNDRLLRPARSGIFLRSFRLHSGHYARETIAKICSLGARVLRAYCALTRGPGCGLAALPVRRMRRTLATAIIGQAGS
jgi:hypothetical protein